MFVCNVSAQPMFSCIVPEQQWMCDCSAFKLMLQLNNTASMCDLFSNSDHLRDTQRFHFADDNPIHT